MAAAVVDRASPRLVLGGDTRALHGACALDAPAARRKFRFACSPCVLEKEVWPTSASGENICELHRQLNVMKATLAPTFVVSGRSRRREKLTGSDLRSLVAPVPDLNEDVLR